MTRWALKSQNWKLFCLKNILLLVDSKLKITFWNS
jgi:hypothetical protein